MLTSGSSISSMLFFFCLLLSCIPTITSSRATERLAQFLNFEFNINISNTGIHTSNQRVLPIQDTTNETFFVSGIIPRKIMQNISLEDMESYLGTSTENRHLPISSIREELSRCLKMNYGSLTSSHFKYDKGMHGWFTMLRIACLELDENDYYFAIAHYRSRFRLKQVLLRRQHTYWATSGRNLVSRDIHKMTSVFMAGFQRFIDDELQNELENIGNLKKHRISSPIIRITSDSYKHFTDFSPIEHLHFDGKAAFQSFESVNLPITIRTLVTRIDKKAPVLDTLTEDLDAESYNTLSSCEREPCMNESDLEMDVNSKTKFNQLAKIRVLSIYAGYTDTLMLYESSRPSFKVPEMKKRTANGVVDMRPPSDEVLEEIWDSLLAQQLSVTMRFHAPGLFNAVNETLIKENNSEEYDD